MKRGDIWTVSGGAGYASKPRPALIIQADAFETIDSTTFCMFTSDRTFTSILRPTVVPDELNNLRETSDVMIDKIMSVQRGRFGSRIGTLAPDDIAAVNQALLTFLDLIG